MRHKLRWLTTIAGITLLSMVGLQIFWLRATYKEQKRTFLSDAETTLFSVMMSEALNKLSTDDTSLGAAFKSLSVAGFSSGFSKVVTGTGRQENKLQMSISIPDSVLMDTAALSRILHKLKKKAADSNHAFEVEVMPDSNDLMQEKLSAFKAAYIRQMARKGYAAKLELGIADSAGTIIHATCDTSFFKNISDKTSPDWLLDIQKGGVRNRVQIGFPDLGILLLQRMGPILFISTLLIILCLSSSSYLLILFFRQKKIAEIRNDFMNNMTHELKTPISSVSVAIELMSDAGKNKRPEAMNNYLQIAQGELNRLTMLVEKVLKIAAFEKSNIDIRKEDFPADEWLLQITNSFKPIFETGGVVCQVSIRPEVLILDADKLHLTNVLQNLVDNAIKYNNKEVKMIDIIVQETSTEVYIMVKDNGMGISATDQQKVFDKFFRVPHGNRHDIKGYGLGLSYVKEIIRLHEGTIKVESAMNQGSNFIITLPK